MDALCRDNPTVTPDQLANKVWERFNKDQELHVLPVLDDEERPIGLVVRRTIIEAYSRPYAHDLYRHKTTDFVMDCESIVIEASASIDDLARIIADAGMHHMWDGFVVTEGGKYKGVGTGHDLLNAVIDRKQAHLFQLAHFDSLTDLPNRNLFMDRLEKSCRDLAREESQVAVLFVDLDRFKYINDTQGHPAGDHLLVSVAERLKQVVRSTDTVARFGGDEFTIILRHITDVHAVVSVVEKIFSELRAPFVINDRTFNITASIGIAMTGRKETDVNELIRKADTAMYHAKERGKNTYKFYQDNLTAQVNETVRLESCLRKALANGEFRLVYQPIFYSQTGELHSVEALLRWESAEMGFIPPDKFIPLAEELGLIKEIGHWVLEQACDQIICWQNEGVKDIKVAVNVSGRQITGNRFAQEVEEVIRSKGVAAESLILEVTESFILETPNLSIAALHKLKKMGVGIALDDFGTGYSSMSYFKQLPINELKIDRSFVKDMAENTQDEAIVRAIVMMAHSLGIKIVAEGIETEQHLTLVQALACDYIQGYYMSRPVSASAIPSLLTCDKVAEPLLKQA